MWPVSRLAARAWFRKTFPQTMRISRDHDMERGLGVLMMRPRDWFRLAVRIIGFWFLASAAATALWAVWKGLGGAGNPAITPGAEVASALIDLIRGLAIVLLVEPIVWLFYGLPRKPAPPAGSDQPPPAASG